MAWFNQYKAKTALEEAEDAMGAMRGTIDVLSQRLHDTLTVRDHFAIAALTSLLSLPQSFNDETPSVASEWAYKFADAMLERRAALGEGK